MLGRTTYHGKPQFIAQIYVRYVRIAFPYYYGLSSQAKSVHSTLPFSYTKKFFICLDRSSREKTTLIYGRLSDVCINTSLRLVYSGSTPINNILGLYIDQAPSSYNTIGHRVSLGNQNDMAAASFK